MIEILTVEEAGRPWQNPGNAGAQAGRPSVFDVRTGLRSSGALRARPAGAQAPPSVPVLPDPGFESRLEVLP